MKLPKSPWLELNLMYGVVILSFASLMLITKGAETPPGGMSLNSISLLTFGFFLLSFAIACIAIVSRMWSWGHNCLKSHLIAVISG